MECPHTSHSIHWPSLVTLCISRHLTSASWHSLQHSAVCSCCSLFTIGQRFTAELLQVSGQYAAYGHQWLIMSESCHRYIIRSRRILVRSIMPSLHLCILYSHTRWESALKSRTLNYLPGGLHVVRFTSLRAWCPWWDPWHWTQCGQTRIRRGEFSGVRSYDNKEYFDEKSVPHSIRAAPAARPGSSDWNMNLSDTVSYLGAQEHNTSHILCSAESSEMQSDSI